MLQVFLCVCAKMCVLLHTIPAKVLAMQFQRAAWYERCMDCVSLDAQLEQLAAKLAFPRNMLSLGHLWCSKTWVAVEAVRRFTFTLDV